MVGLYIMVCGGMVAIICISLFFGEWDLLRGPVVVIDYEDGDCVWVFFSCHSSPMYGFYCCFVVRRVG